MIPAGPIGPWIGAPVDGRRSRGVAGFDIVVLVYPLEVNGFVLQLKFEYSQNTADAYRGVLYLVI